MMGTRGADLPARALVPAAVLTAAACAVPAVRQLDGLGAVGGAGATGWTVCCVLAAVHAGCVVLTRERGPWAGLAAPGRAGRAREADGAPPLVFPVLLAGVFLLPPSGAALVAVPGALLAPLGAGAGQRLWHAARLVLALYAAGLVRALCERACGAQGAVQRAELPLALVAAPFVAVTFALVLAVLDGTRTAVTGGRVPATLRRGLCPRTVGPHLVHGAAGLMMAVLWRSAYGPVAGLFVLLPMLLSSWGFAQYRAERAAYRATIGSLVKSVDIKDRYTCGHGERVGRACALIARELGMGERRAEELRLAGLLHDVGKLGVPTRVLRKNGPLTPAERQEIERHPELGDEIVRGIGFLGEARPAILHHHERYDGDGYPYGLAGARIPQAARIVAVADAFDAMTSTRSYRRGRPVDAALAELERCAGSQFDPQAVGALVRALAKHDWARLVADVPGPPSALDAEDASAARAGAGHGAAAGGRPGGGNVPAR